MKHGTGLYISLLFIPALALAYRSIAQPEFSALMALRQKLSAPLSPMALVPLAAAVPVGFTASRLRNADLPPVVAMIAAIAGVGVFGTLFGFQRSSLTTAVLAALSVFVVSRWPADSSRTRNAVLLIAANLVLSWMLEVHSGGYHA